MDEETASANNGSLGNFAFLYFGETEKRDGYMAAVLVTDDKGVPLEFRCTRPVKPNAFQRPLFGQSLEPHIGVRLCGEPLLKALKKAPTVVFVNKPYMVDLRRDFDGAVLFVRSVGEAVEVIPGQNVATEHLKYEATKFKPIVCEWHAAFPNDKPIATAVLSHCEKYLDPLEPFVRITQAISALKSDARFT